MDEIYIAGCPSEVGGANTEIMHLMDLWIKAGIQINVVPLTKRHDVLDHYLHLGVKEHKYHPSIFNNKIVLGWCNQNLLRELPNIYIHGSPKAVVWANCMTFLFPEEIAAHANGWITHYAFVSDYQKQQLLPKLQQYKDVKELQGYKPYFSFNNPIQQHKFSYHKPQTTFNVGRVSRDDGQKFHSNMWYTFNKIKASLPVKALILGYGEKARFKTGPKPHGSIYSQTWEPNEIPVNQIYNQLHCLLHQTGGSKESYCRTVIEAYANGIPPVVEDDYAFPQTVLHGETGYRCKNTDEFVTYTSLLGSDEDTRKAIARKGYEYLRDVLNDEETCLKPWERLLNE